ncbi:MAG TPA: hypothetical protein VHU17_02465, partial [Acidimicrobiales bacterium]|nr:hypothetical protein [Acidimicrobiales bacterium]
MKVHQLGGQRESDAGTLMAPGTGSRHPVKAFEQPVELTRFDADPGVGDLKESLPIAVPKTDGDAS